MVVKNNKLYSLTLYGCIGIRCPVMHYAKGCNSENLADFIPMMDRACQNLRNQRKPVLVLDQHVSHKKMMPFLEDTFEVMM